MKSLVYNEDNIKFIHILGRWISNTSSFQPLLLKLIRVKVALHKELNMIVTYIIKVFLTGMLKKY